MNLKGIFVTVLSGGTKTGEWATVCLGRMLRLSIRNGQLEKGVAVSPGTVGDSHVIPIGIQLDKVLGLRNYHKRNPDSQMASEAIKEGLSPPLPWPFLSPNLIP